MEWRPHITVAAVIKKAGKYLFVEEKINDKIVINQPAGHLEKNESLVDAVKREVLEETGGIFMPAGLVGIYNYPNYAEDITYIRFCFHGDCGTFIKNPQLDEVIIRTLWLAKDELDSQSSKLRSHIVRKCINDYESGAAMPLNILK
ncbi:MAG: NUDIX hydrolase [Gammaproteobacteria bacterium]|nr:NUDIX hydrolase [Gammaproteobacteria bacterium]